jgi:hypothetical protein
LSTIKVVKAALAKLTIFLEVVADGAENFPVILNLRIITVEWV